MEANERATYSILLSCGKAMLAHRDTMGVFPSSSGQRSCNAALNMPSLPLLSKHPPNVPCGESCWINQKLFNFVTSKIF
jgi:hypothetical protein